MVEIKTRLAAPRTRTNYPDAKVTLYFLVGPRTYVAEVSTTIAYKDHEKDWKGFKKPRIYIETSDEVDAAWSLDRHPPYGEKGEDPANDAAWDFHNKLYLVAGSLLIDETLKIAYPGITIPIKAKTFSRYAGCQCPCSPGWIMGLKLMDETRIAIDGVHDYGNIRATHLVPVNLHITFRMLGERYYKPKLLTAGPPVDGWRDPNWDYCIIYRTGGWKSFKWHRSMVIANDEIDARLADVERMGYPAFIMDYNLSITLGLPGGYEHGV